VKEAATLLKLSEMRGIEYQPAKDGFVFSTAEIHAVIDRQHRLDRAPTTDFTRYNPENSKPRPPDCVGFEFLRGLCALA